MHLCLCSKIIYKCAYGRCSATYYGKTCYHFDVKVDEQSSIPPLMNKESKSMKSTAVKDHILMNDHIVSFVNVEVLNFNNSEFQLKIKESLLVSRDQLILKIKEASLPLCLFEYSLIWLCSYCQCLYISIFCILFSIIKYMLQWSIKLYWKFVYKIFVKQEYGLRMCVEKKIIIFIYCQIYINMNLST